MKPIFALCFFSVFLARPAFAVFSGPRWQDTVRDATTGELYWVYVHEVSISRESLSGKSPNSSGRGFGFKAIVTYHLENLAPEDAYAAFFKDEKISQNCPKGWQNQDSECLLSVPLSPPLTFVLDTGENRKRHFSKAERDSALNACKHCKSCHNYIAGSEHFYGIRRVCDFIYLDKAGKSHEVTFARQYDSERGRFVSKLRYPLDSGKCDKGWFLDDRSEWRKRVLVPHCIKNKYDSTSKKLISREVKISADGKCEDGWTFVSADEYRKQEKFDARDRCYYAIPDPPLFSPKKKPAKRPGKAR